MNFDILICARSGSKGVRNKNIRKVGKKSLLAQTIDMAMKVKRINNVFVSTDSLKYKKISENIGAIVPFLRPKILSGDNVPEWKVWKHFVLNQKKYNNNLIILPTTSPFRKLIDIKNAISLFRTNKFDIVIGIAEDSRNPYFNMVEKVNKKYFKLSKTNLKYCYRRQDAPKVYSITTFFYILNSKFILNKNSMHQGKIGAVIVPKDRSLDIDTELDLRFARFLHKNINNI